MIDQIWSKYPQEAYTVTVPDGRVMGLGVHPAFSTAPGAWNIFWLTCPALDDLAYYKGDPANYYHTMTSLPICVGAALQLVPMNEDEPGSVTYGQLATRHTPSEFIKIVGPDKDNFLLSAYYGDYWFKLAEGNTKKYEKNHGNVVHHDFRR